VSWLEAGIPRNANRKKACPPQDLASNFNVFISLASSLIKTNLNNPIFP